MKARSLPSCTIDLCSVFLKDQFSFIVTGKWKRSNNPTVSCSTKHFFTGVISPERESKKKKNRNNVFFKVFNHQKCGRYIFFKRQIHVFGCKCVAKYREGWQRNHNSCLVYTLICLNIPQDDHQFFGNLSLEAGQSRFKTKVLTRAPNWCNVHMAAGW